MTGDFVGIVNPISGSGSGETAWRATADILRRHGATTRTVVSRSRADAITAAGAAATAGDTVVAVGGDGVIRDVAGGVLAAGGESPLGIVAAGRGNDLARHLGLPLDPAAAAEVLLHGVARTIDVIDVAGNSPALGNVYVGLDSVATEIINTLRPLGTISYRIGPVLAALRWRPTLFTITIDGRARAVTAHMVIVANSGDYGHGLRMVPSASVTSGTLEVLIVRAHHSALHLANVMTQAKTGAHVQRPEIQVLRGAEITIAAARRVPVHADGDYLQELPVTSRVRPAALPILVPAT